MNEGAIQGMFQTTKPRTGEPRRKKPLAELTQMSDIKSLWLRPKNQQLFAQIEAALSWKKEDQDTYLLPVIKRFLEYVESLPDSTNRFYAEPHGFSEYALQRTEAALTLFAGYLIIEKNGLSAIQRCWQYALFTAALLLGIGKLYLDYNIELYDDFGGYIENWNPVFDNLINKSPYYLLKTQHQANEIGFRTRLNLILAKNILPSSGFEWIASHREIFAAWLALINEDIQGVKVLGAILSRAEDIAMIRALDEWFEKQGLGQKTRTIRTFIDKNTDSNKFLSDQIGVAFIQWLKDKLQTGDLAFNDNDGNLTLSKNGVGLNVELFKLFIKDFPTYKNWQAVQKGFLALGLTDESGIDTAEISFANFGILLPAKASVYNKSLGVKSWINAVELKDFVMQGKTIVSGQKTENVMTLPHINAKGQLQIIEENSKFLNPGQNFRG